MPHQRSKTYEKNVVEAVMRLKQLIHFDRVNNLGDGLYTHTNTRGRTRHIQLCNSQTHAKVTAEQTNGEYFKSYSCWVCLYEK